MKDREQEYRELFKAEALESHEQLNHQLLALEKDPANTRALAELFRLLHNLKANARAIGYTQLAELAHRMENIFSMMRNGEIALGAEGFNILMDGIDLLGLLIRKEGKPDETLPFNQVLENLDFLTRGGSEEEADVPEIKKYLSGGQISLSDQIYIPIRKLDTLLNLVGELIIDRDRLSSIANRLGDDEFNTVTSHLYRVTNAIQAAVMDTRLIAIGSLFNKFPRIVRDVAQSEGKQVELEITGQDIRIDRNVLQIITDSLLHLIRNAINHGIESEEERKAAGKSPVGHLYLHARSDKDKVLVQVRDDGRGIDIAAIRRAVVEKKMIPREKAKAMTPAELLSVIFEPGFSTSVQVSEISGRGVGLDIVKTALDAIGGRVSVESKAGQGTTFNLFLPTSIAVKGSLLFDISENTYAIPLVHIDSVLQVPAEQLNHIGKYLVLEVKGQPIPVLNLTSVFEDDKPMEEAFSTPPPPVDWLHIIVVIYNNRKIGLIVDRLVRQQDIVVKSLQRPVDNVELFGGVTLLGNGEVCLVLDIPNLARRFIQYLSRVPEEV